MLVRHTLFAIFHLHERRWPFDVFPKKHRYIFALPNSFTVPMIAKTTGGFLQAYGGNEFSSWVGIAHFIMDVFS